MSGGAWQDVGPEDAIARGGLLAFEARARSLCVGRTDDGRWFALDDRCPHAGGSLARGLVDGDQVICPLHAYAFDIETGQCPDDPSCAVRTYAARVLNGRLQVRT